MSGGASRRLKSQFLALPLTVFTALDVLIFFFLSLYVCLPEGLIMLFSNLTIFDREFTRDSEVFRYKASSSSLRKGIWQRLSTIFLLWAPPLKCCYLQLFIYIIPILTPYSCAQPPNNQDLQNHFPHFSSYNQLDHC